MRPLAFLLLLLPTLSFAQIGKPFPTMACETLAGRSETLPTALKGKHSIVMMVQSLDAEEQLIRWVEEVYFVFIMESTGDNFMAFEAYDVNLRVVPLIAGLKQAGYNKIRARMNEDLDPAAQEYVSLYKGSLSPYDSQLGLRNKNDVYVFVLDPSGQVVAAVNGPFSEQKMEILERNIPAVE